MSKTDKTKPWAVRVMEHNPWANHDHSDGICDLPEHYRDNVWGDPTKAPHCRWSDWNICRRDGCCHGCACRMCSGYYERLWERRRDRHQAQREAQAMTKTWRELD